jgi:hypothetical protein
MNGTISTATPPAVTDENTGPELNIVFNRFNTTSGGMPVFAHVDPETGTQYEKDDSVATRWYFGKKAWELLGRPDNIEVIVRPVR